MLSKRVKFKKTYKKIAKVLVDGQGKKTAIKKISFLSSSKNHHAVSLMLVDHLKLVKSQIILDEFKLTSNLS